MARNWSYFDKFEGVTDKWLPDMGEGETRATQIVTAVTKLVYRWFNDGDIYDNRFCLQGWDNNLSSYANWLHTYCGEETQDILERISKVYGEGEYTELLGDLADLLLREEYLEGQDKLEKIGTIYDCKGVFEFEEYEDEEEYYDEYEDEYEDDDEYDY